MKVLILGSVPPSAFKALNIDKPVYGAGWVENLISFLSKEEIEVYCMFITAEVNEVIFKKYDGINFVAVPETSGDLESKFNSFKNTFDELLKNINPDLVHIIGTEREYNYSMFKAFDKPNRTIISLTGLITYCGEYYLGNIDKNKIKRRTIGDVLRKWGPLIEQDGFFKAAVYEQKLLKEAKYVFGRTSWDKEKSLGFNPNLNYIHCGEIINPVFYSKEWDFDKCEKHSIFISQASYPLKGFHFLIEALPEIIKKYPDTKVYVAGTDMFDSSTLIKRIKRSTYANYLLKQIKRLKIDKNCIKFVGYLSSEQMMNQYLKANVFVLSSTVENSPNSLGEAMTLGVPSVASCVGGVPDMMENDKDGLIYPSNNSSLLGKHIISIFEDKELALKFSKNAKVKARQFFNKEDAIKTTIKTYKIILGE